MAKLSMDCLFVTLNSPSFDTHSKRISQEELAQVMQTLKGHKLQSQKSQLVASLQTSWVHMAFSKLSTSLKQVVI